MAKGYTLIEMMMVIAVAGAVAVIGFFGMRSADQNQKLDNATKELVSDLRASQNFINSGGTNAGIPVRLRKFVFNGGNNYSVIDYNSSLTQISSRPTSLAGIAVSGNIICFLNPNATVTASGCSNTDQTITLTNSTTSQTKTINLNISALFVTKIYGN